MSSADSSTMGSSEHVLGDDHGGSGDYMSDPTVLSAVESLTSFLITLSPVLFTGVKTSDQDSLRTSLTTVLQSNPSRDELFRFVRGVDCSTLLVEELENHLIRVGVELKPTFGKHTVRSAFVLVKNRDTPLDTTKSITSQLQVVTLMIEGGALSTEESRQTSYLQSIQHVARNLFAPIGRSTKSSSQLQATQKSYLKSSVQQAISPSSANVGEDEEHVALLQKRIRELDFALEQCCRGTFVPSVIVPVPPLLITPASHTTSTTLRTHLDRYNVAQVDAHFTEIGLTSLMGEGEDAREEFAKEVNKTAKLWPPEIIKQTRLIDSTFAGSVEKEINFWKDMERKLSDTKEQLESAPILLTKLVLKRTNRVSEQLIIEAESVLDRSMKVINDSLSFLRDFPFTELQEANTLHPQLSRCVGNCLNHFSKLRHIDYDFTRAVRMLEALGTVVVRRVVSILREKNIMQCSMEDLTMLRRQYDDVQLVWTSNLTSQRAILMDVSKRRNERFSTLRFADFDALTSRMNEIIKFRTNHQRMVDILQSVSPDTEFFMDVNKAFQMCMHTIPDVFDITPVGVTSWNAGIQQYDNSLKKVDETIKSIIGDRLKNAHNTDEMFRVFATFNPLFYRPEIVSAVNVFRPQLMRHVREDVSRLSEKFKCFYNDSQEKVTAELHDLPPLSGLIVWAKQIESQILNILQRIQDVLGDDWKRHSEGINLKNTCDQLLSKLDVNPYYEKWLLENLEKKASNKYSRLRDFLLLVEMDSRIQTRSVRVNFDEKNITFYKEVKYLEWLLPRMNGPHTSIPTNLKDRATAAYARHGIAVALMNAINVYNTSKSRIKPFFAPLLTSSLQSVRLVIKQAIGGTKTRKWVKWDVNADDLNEWCVDFVSTINTFSEHVDDVCNISREIEKLLSTLESCEYVTETMEGIVKNIQTLIDSLPKTLSNVPTWVLRLDHRVELILVKKVRTAVNAWVNDFEADYVEVRAAQTAAFAKRMSIRDSKHMSMNFKHLSVEFSEDDDALEVMKPMLHSPIDHEIVVDNEVWFLDPPLEHTKKLCISYFHQYLSLAAGIQRLSSTTNEVLGTKKVSEAPVSYTAIIDQLGHAVLRRPYEIIEKKISEARHFVAQWLEYKSMCNTSPSDLTDHLSNNLKDWEKFLKDMRAARQAIDSTVDQTSFGPLIVHNRLALSMINLKYDSWQKETQILFGRLVLESTRTLHAELSSMKSKLETLTLEGSTRDAILGIEFMLKVKSCLPELVKKAAELSSGESVLQSQRFTFPADWLRTSNVNSVLGDLQSILDRRSGAMNEQLPLLQHRVREEDSNLRVCVDKFLEDWLTNKPIDGALTAAAAMESLSMFSSRLSKLLEDTTRLRSAKDSLGMDYVSDNRLEPVESDIADLRNAWGAISPISDKLIALGNVPLRETTAVNVRKQLDELLNDLRALPAKVRSYAAVELASERLTQYLNFQPVLRDVCTDSLKERHWRALIDRLDLKVTPKNLTVGVIWESDALNKRKQISEVLASAQGELALEQFLRDMKEHWVSRELTVLIRDGAKIIIGWEALFGSFEDNLSSLASLKQSPYFRNVPEFQEDCTFWDTRLTLLRAIFEVWMEVQRKWLYLRGIFRNADIKAQLPAQYSKFKSIDSEYNSLMKRVSAKPIVLDVLSIDNLQRQLEREEATMTLIQKALGEYLERQRQLFPRFYFVNNDELIEIIGNSNEPSKVFPHLSKMFAAINNLNVNAVSTDSSAAIAMVSKEGETVPFSVTGGIDLGVGVKEWLGGVESEMVVTLADSVSRAFSCLKTISDAELLRWMSQYPTQITVLAAQLLWTSLTEEALINAAAKVESKSSTIHNAAEAALKNVLLTLDNRLQCLSLSVLEDMEVDIRRKCEQLLTEMIHQRDVSRLLISGQVEGASDFGWLYHLRFYWQTAPNLSPKEQLSIRMSNASFHYGFEYLGVTERLVQTPLTDRCYLTLTQALHFRMGANPFGPAGTGKTESVKMLGAQLGRFVLVFNCDSAFDYAAMGRIFAGLCQVGAWGCFDEFNRLEERILSAVSQQILAIQHGLMKNQASIELMGQQVKLSPDVGIFVTLNPGYAGRSNLPDNLKQLFRAVAMSVPDRRLIAQVMLFSQGIATAEVLAGKIVLVFVLCEEQLSTQSHYDFGLRALKSVLVGAGELKRKALAKSASQSEEGKESLEDMETAVLIKAACDSILPKLVADDIPLFLSLLSAVFPGCELPGVGDEVLLDAVREICAEECFEPSEDWLHKLLQLKQVQEVRHGIMLVGASGTGKSSTWRTLLHALSRVDGVKAESFVIDPKAISKEKLFGTLDPNTLEWTDGVFTKILRKLTDSSSVRGSRRSWIVFDGDVDPEWAENLNSVLDDNRVLTLPSGDRLVIPPNVRIVMEVDDLKYATLATVSRCGMVFFSDSVVTRRMACCRQLELLKKQVVFASDGSFFADTSGEVNASFVSALQPLFDASPSVVEIALDASLRMGHVIELTATRALETLYAMLTRGVAICFEYNEQNNDQLSNSLITQFATKWLCFSLVWSFGASLSGDNRAELAELIADNVSLHVPLNFAGSSGRRVGLLDLSPSVSDGQWIEWATQVPKLEIESHRVTSTDVVVTTTDTVRHAAVIRAWLLSRKPLILCGPPGSGKTMTLTNVLESTPECVLAPLNFSSGTTPELILKTFAQYCEMVDSPEGLIMQPNRSSYRDNQWLVVFCDEINLPAADVYGTQRVISFLRQLTEQGGYWSADCKWISLRRIQFVGACNPPTDAGRVDMTHRFMRHSPILFVDYPSEQSLKQIYRCFSSALLRVQPSLKGFTDPLTDAMVDLYLRNKAKFTADIAPQYIYSPRELSRWVRALYEAIEPLDAMTPEELVRLWAHEALRLFSDRIISVEDREWCSNEVDVVAARHFPGIDVSVCLKRPILYSQWISKTYDSIDRDSLRNFVSARLKVFYEEELDVPLVVFDEVLEHVLRIDNVLRHPMGHLLLVGESGVGKTVLTRFVAWMNGLSIFTIKANSRYTLEQFDEDLRSIFRRVGIEGEKICFIFDESNALSSAFLERMNALLASGEVPGLFEGDDRSTLMAACRDSFNQRDGLVLDSEDELYRRFTREIQRNLHVVFTMNPASSDFENRCTTSPALFNRCVVDWFGTWSDSALTQVAEDFTRRVDTGYIKYTPPSCLPVSLENTQMVLKQTSEPTMSEAIVATLVELHATAKELVVSHGKSSGRQHYLSPRDYLDLIHKFTATEEEKRSGLEDQQTHIRLGLEKLRETQEQVAALNDELTAKNEILRVKDAEANEKLTLMVDKQNEAEQRKATAEQLAVQLLSQNEQIRIRKDVVEKELSDAEPALISAKQSVSNIRKSQLDEVRALARPPNAVRMTMEMVCLMIGESNSDWTEVRKVIRRDDFISTVVHFDPLSLTPKAIKAVQDNFLSAPDFTYESVDRASKACGPLFMWASSQINYATILKKIKPLRDEMAGLQTQSDALKAQHTAATEEVVTLEADIKTYKAEYAAAIRQTEIIRNEMESVERRVTRANSLLSSLSEEKDRWELTSTSFDEQMSTLIGDCLLASAFLTYSGIFDHRTRSRIMCDWIETLESMKIPFRRELDMSAYLSSPTDQLHWTSEYDLPKDSLAIQNAIILERHRRFPLVIDPSGQAQKFLMKKFASQKIILTSFLDASFMKTLASAIRFGTPLLVQDVENLDPILNPVLNRELQRTGGRTLIRLGSEEIDFSPKFLIILITRNPFARFSPDLCSRVTTVNFTITPLSLESQVLSSILKSERPDVDKRRSDVLRLQGEQNAKLRELQDKLLDNISAVRGAILDDDSVIQTLETIKSDAAQLMQDSQQTSSILEEVKMVSNQYNALASTISSVFFTLESLAEVHYMYQYSLEFFLQIVSKVLNGEGASASVPVSERIRTLIGVFLREVVRRVLPGLCYEDKLVFLVRVSQMSAMGRSELELSDAESDFLTKGSAHVELPESLLARHKEAFSELTETQVKQLASLSLLPAFDKLLGSYSSESGLWNSILTSSKPDASELLTKIIRGSLTPERKSLLNVLILRAVRPESVLTALEDYASTVFQSFQIDWRAYSDFNFADVVDKDSQASSPLLLCSQPGQDASAKVDSLAASNSKNLLQVSMGSAEGFSEAERIISLASKNGSWVLLRNVHLCTDWLVLLEKKLFGMTFNDNFRLFLTCEVHEKIPVALLRRSDVLMFESSSGLKSNLQRFFTRIPKARMERQPAERSRLYSLLAWFNSIVQERLRYAPLGWTKKYEFMESDLSCTLDVIDTWVDTISGTRNNVDPELLPWAAFRTLISESLYGGRIDRANDQAVLDAFVESIFSPRNYDSSAVLVRDENGSPLLSLPDSLTRSSFEKWIHDLPDSNPPAWISLPSTAEHELKKSVAQRMLKHLAVLQGMVENVSQDSSNSKIAVAQRKAMVDTVKRWSSSLPTVIDLTNKFDSLPTITTVVGRTLLREAHFGVRVLEEVRTQLDALLNHLENDVKLTNQVRDLMSCYRTATVPMKWKKLYAVTDTITLSAWMEDCSLRIQQVSQYYNILKSENSWSDFSFNLGRMYAAEAFLIATRQEVAQTNKWSLEDLELYLDINGDSLLPMTSQDTTTDGLIMQGAKWNPEKKYLEFSDDLRFKLSTCKFKWHLKKSEDVKGHVTTIPVYVNDTRAQIVAQVKVSTSSVLDATAWAQRSVACILQPPVV